MTINTQHLGRIQLRESVHSDCFVCGSSNPHGLHLTFDYDQDGDCVVSKFQLQPWTGGYKGIPHGGVISAICDCAMGNCLFAKGIRGVTAELKIRFKQTLQLQKNAIVKAWVTHHSNTLYMMEAEIVQDGQVKAIAEGKFVNKPDLVNAPEP